MGRLPCGEKDYGWAAARVRNGRFACRCSGQSVNKIAGRPRQGHQQHGIQAPFPQGEQGGAKKEDARNVRLRHGVRICDIHPSSYLWELGLP